MGGPRPIAPADASAMRDIPKPPAFYKDLIADIRRFRANGAPEDQLNAMVQQETHGVFKSAASLEGAGGFRGILTNYAQGLLMNFGDNAAGVVNAFVKDKRTRLPLLKMVTGLLAPAGTPLAAAGQEAQQQITQSPDYQQAQQRVNATAQAAQQMHPVLSGAAGMAGAAVPFMAAGGGEPPAGFGLPRIAGAAAKNAALGGLSGAASAVGAGQNPLPAGLLGAAAGGVLGGAAEVPAAFSSDAAAAARAGQAVNRSAFVTPEQMARGGKGGPLGEPLRGEAALRASAAAAGEPSRPAIWTPATGGAADFAANNSPDVAQTYGMVMALDKQSIPADALKAIGSRIEKLGKGIQVPPDSPLIDLARGVTQLADRGMVAPPKLRVLAEQALSTGDVLDYDRLRQALGRAARQIGKAAKSGGSATVDVEDAAVLNNWGNAIAVHEGDLVPGFNEWLKQMASAGDRLRWYNARVAVVRKSFSDTRTAARLAESHQLDPSSIARPMEWGGAGISAHGIKHILFSPLYNFQNRVANKLGPLMFEPNTAEGFLQGVRALRRPSPWWAPMAGGALGRGASMAAGGMQ